MQQGAEVGVEGQRLDVAGPVVDHHDLRGRRPAAPASPLSSRVRLGRPTVGTTTAYCRSVAAVIRRSGVGTCPHDGPDAGRGPARRRERTRKLERVPGVVDHRPSRGVEAGVDHHRQPGAALERPQQRGDARGRSSSSTVWMRAVPSTWTTAGMRSRHSGRTSCTNSMYGLGIGPSVKIVGARSVSTIGATGPELLAALDVVEPLEVLGAARVGHQRALSERARPELAAPVEPGDDTVVGEHGGRLVGDVVRRGERHVGRAAARRRARRRSSRARGRPSVNGSAGSPASAHSCRAAPSDVPASPAAGCTHTSSNGVSRQMRVLATQFNAVPPAMARVRSPVRSCSQQASSTSTSSRHCCTDAARSACSAAQSVSSAPRGRRPLRPVGHRRDEATVAGGVDQSRAAGPGGAACRTTPAPSP